MTITKKLPNGNFFLNFFKKTIDKPTGLWYNKDNEREVIKMTYKEMFNKSYELIEKINENEKRIERKENIQFIIGIIVIIAITAVSTFIITMNNLDISVNEDANGALVECFGQVWYHDTEELNYLVEIENK